MSLNKSLQNNDDYLIALSGVYLKEVKRQLRKQGENSEPAISRRQSIRLRNEMDDNPYS